MPARVSAPSTDPATVAPDGIAIHTFDVPGAAHVGVAEGRVPPGVYGIHRHLSLEQFTYVVAGSLTAITGDHAHPNGHATTLGPGDLLLTLPGESLQFINEGTETARVLFICAPPYPADDRDTRTTTHGGAGPAEIDAAIERMRAVRAEFNRVIDRRIAALRNPSPGPSPRRGGEF